MPKMRNRIGDFRTEIVARVEKLKSIPGLHAREDRAIDHALNALRFLERERERYNENQRRQALETVMRNLQFIVPRIKKMDDSASEERFVQEVTSGLRADNGSVATG
jgi:hypothetical protein